MPVPTILVDLNARREDDRLRLLSFSLREIHHLGLEVGAWIRVEDEECAFPAVLERDEKGCLVARVDWSDDGSFRPSREETETLRPVFEEYARRWHEDVRHLSSTTKRTHHFSPLAIVAMGRPAIPLLLEALAEGEGDWDIALAEITGFCAPSAAVAGRMGDIRAAWLGWGQAAGWIE
jgi:hypothetical protein